MSKGYLILAQNSLKVNYVMQAVVLAMTIKLTQPTIHSVSLVTDDSVPEKYQHLFDNIISIPWSDLAVGSEWKVENRWKLYHVSPYEETVVLDADMLFLDSIEHWWSFLHQHDLLFTSTVNTYRNTPVLDETYRKTFLSNDLPNLYFAFHYFKKSDFALDFYSTLEIVCKNWQELYAKVTPNETQKWMSMDVSGSITAKILGIEDKVSSAIAVPTFTHMKSAIQGWKNPPSKWTDFINFSIDEDCRLKIGNFSQTGIFHYVEEEFLTKHIVKTIEEKYDRHVRRI